MGKKTNSDMRSLLALNRPCPSCGGTMSRQEPILRLVAWLALVLMPSYVFLAAKGSSETWLYKAIDGTFLMEIVTTSAVLSLAGLFVAILYAQFDRTRSFACRTCGETVEVKAEPLVLWQKVFFGVGVGCIVALCLLWVGVTVRDAVLVSVDPSARATVDLHGQGLASVPQNMLQKENVETLDLSGNALTGAVPAEIRQLTRLRELDLSDNQLTGVPAEIGQLSELEVLDLSNNQLTGLPHELGNLSKLRVLDLSGNPGVSEADLAVIRARLSPDVEIRR